jgi:hypothetical protein
MQHTKKSNGFEKPEARWLSFFRSYYSTVKLKKRQLCNLQFVTRSAFYLEHLGFNPLTRLLFSITGNGGNKASG